MPYHRNTTTQDLFIQQHLHTATKTTDITCSICRQRCTHRHIAVQIYGVAECQCVFGRPYVEQWLHSDSTASNTCPSCRTVWFNPHADSVVEDSDSDDEDEDEDEDGPSQGRARGRRAAHERSRRAAAPSPSPSRTSTSFSSSSLSGNDGPLNSSAKHPRRPRRIHLQHRRALFPPVLPLQSLPHLQPQPHPPHPTTIDNLVSDLWAGTWDLVTDSQDDTPVGQRARSITHAQLLGLTTRVYPYQDINDALTERLALQARKMVQKHRRNGRWVGKEEAKLRNETEHVELGVAQYFRFRNRA